jgi:hypothetical protein
MRRMVERKDWKEGSLMSPPPPSVGLVRLSDAKALEEEEEEAGQGGGDVSLTNRGQLHTDP